MGSMRFRFDGQPINETDTPAQVRNKYMFTKIMQLIRNYDINIL